MVMLELNINLYSNFKVVKLTVFKGYYMKSCTPKKKKKKKYINAEVFNIYN